MTRPILILGGAAEGAALARAAADAGLPAVYSYAGRVKSPKAQPLPTRVGGFGGPEGLAAYLRAENIAAVIDATHPFAARMSRNAAEACAQTGVPLLAYTRPAWAAGPGDDWTHVADVAAAVRWLDRPALRVMLATGRMHLAEFAANPQHFHLLRLVDAPGAPPPFPDHHVEVSRGPFTAAGDRALMQAHRIELVVAKNAGGMGARAKIDAARDLGIPVLMIDRPPAPARPETGDLDEVLAFARAHAGAERGV